MLKSENANLRHAAAIALERMGPDASGAVPELRETLKSENVHLRYAAAKALGRIGPNAKGAVPELREMLKSDNAHLAHAAAEALAAIVASGSPPAQEEAARIAPVDRVELTLGQSHASGVGVTSQDTGFTIVVLTGPGDDVTRIAVSFVSDLGETNPGRYRLVAVDQSGRHYQPSEAMVVAGGGRRCQVVTVFARYALPVTQIRSVILSGEEVAE